MISFVQVYDYIYLTCIRLDFFCSSLILKFISLLFGALLEALCYFLGLIVSDYHYIVLFSVILYCLSDALVGMALNASVSFCIACLLQ